MADSDTDRIFAKLDEIGKAVTSTQVDVAVLSSQMPVANSRLDEFALRIRSLENRLWSAVGALGLLAFAIPIALKFLLPW